MIIAMEMPSIFPVTCHTDHVGPGSTFIAIHGDAHDGTNYIITALKKGACTIVIQQNTVLTPEISAQIRLYNASIQVVENTRAALAHLSAQAAGYPAKQLKIIGITGTKGKTTSAYLLKHLLSYAGYNTALISTVENTINTTVLPAAMTTEQPDYLHQFFKQCVHNKIDYVIMEVSAHALTLNRTDTLEFDGALFTNLAQEHGELYPTMQDYFQAKQKLFTLCKPNAPLAVNIDDPWGKRLSEDFHNALTWSVNDHNANLFASAPASYTHGISTYATAKNASIKINCPSLIGTCNLLNILGALTIARALSIDISTLERGLTTFAPIVGRMEKHTLPNKATCIIDYAHNPSSYEETLSTLKKMTDHLIVVFGCGGHRDPARRPIMGRIASKYADAIILTSDNPRTEDPQTIIDDIYAGITGVPAGAVTPIIDRAEAIKYAYQISKKKSIIALLGKGPDEYQIIGTTKYPFKETELLRSLE